MIEPFIFAEPQDISSPEDCIFYHTMDLPGYGLMEGMWDLRPNIDKYLGKVNLKNKRVLDVGAASGFLTFHMENQGAQVIAYDLSANDDVDIVPFAGVDYLERADHARPWLERIKNSFWLAHKAFNSQATAVYGNVYAIPEEIGLVDVSTFGSILLHLRDPFLALQNALRLTQETVIITEPVWNWVNFVRYLLPIGRHGSTMLFVPDTRLNEPATTWWHISPSAMRRFIGVLGFEQARVTYHFQQQKDEDRRVLCYTVVGRRTTPIEQGG